MFKRIIIIFDFVLVAIVFASCVYTYTRPMNLPYNKPALMATVSCDMRIPQPPQDMRFDPVYSFNDPERDDVIEEARENYAQKKSGISLFQNKITAMANAGQADCVLAWLENWADKKALLSDGNQGGVVARQTALAAFSSAYAQIRDETHFNQNVESWLRSLAHTVMKEYPDNADENSKSNNLLYWAAWSATITGIALNDRDIYSWGLRRGEEGIEDIQVDGTLPLEMKRGTRALHYHQYALTPLIMLAEAAARNGQDLYQLNDGALHRLVKRVWGGLEDPTFFNQKTGQIQVDMHSIHNIHFAWVEVYNSRFKDAQMQAWLKTHRPMISSMLGGNMTRLYH